MTTRQKVRRAKELVENEEDGSTYLQEVCTIKEMKDFLSTVKNKQIREIIEDAISIREHNNQMRKGQFGVSV